MKSFWGQTYELPIKGVQSDLVDVCELTHSHILQARLL